MHVVSEHDLILEYSFMQDKCTGFDVHLAQKTAIADKTDSKQICSIFHMSCALCFQYSAIKYLTIVRPELYLVNVLMLLIIRLVGQIYHGIFPLFVFASGHDLCVAPAARAAGVCKDLTWFVHTIFLVFEFKKTIVLVYNVTSLTALSRGSLAIWQCLSTASTLFGCARIPRRACL